MTYRWVEHTAELGLDVEAASEELVFVEAMDALAELLDGPPGEDAEREIALEAEDRASLLVAWLEELLFLADAEGFVPQEADLTLRNTALAARVDGRLTQPRPLVKAATYHELVLEPAGAHWHARVVLDV